MLPDLADIVQVALITGIFVGLVGSVCWISVATYRSVKRIDRQSVGPSAELQGQIEQLQQSVDTIAVEVERIAEAQRYMARLESEREPRHVLPTQS